MLKVAEKKKKRHLSLEIAGKSAGELLCQVRERFMITEVGFPGWPNCRFGHTLNPLWFSLSELIIHRAVYKSVLSITGISKARQFVYGGGGEQPIIDARMKAAFCFLPLPHYPKY